MALIFKSFFSRSFTFAAFLIVLSTVCISSPAQDNPLSFLPDGQAYIGLNFERVRSSPKLMEIVKSFKSQDPVYKDMPPFSSSVLRLYYANPVSFFADAKHDGYFVFTGRDQFANDFIAYANGARQLKASKVEVPGLPERQVYLSEDTYISAVGTTGILMASSREAFSEMMVAASRVPNPTWHNGGFQFVHMSLDNHTIAAAAGPAGTMPAVAAQFKRLPNAPPDIDQAFAAVTMLSLKADWNQKLSIKVTLHTADANKAATVANALNHLLALLKQNASGLSPDPDIQQLVQQVTVGTNTYGAILHLDAANDVADRLWGKIHEQIRQARARAAAETPASGATAPTPTQTPTPTPIPPRRN